MAFYDIPYYDMSTECRGIDVQFSWNGRHKSELCLAGPDFPILAGPSAVHNLLCSRTMYLIRKVFSFNSRSNFALTCLIYHG